MSTKSTRFIVTSPIRRSGTLGALLALAPLLPCGVAALDAQQLSQQAVARGWYAAGSTVPREYSIVLEPLRRPGGTGFVGAAIKGLVEAPYASGILLQSIRTDDYRGRRVRLTAWLRTAADTTAAARLWMRVDGAAGPQISDYMIDRPITGTRDWAAYSVVLDVPGNALGISFGVAFTGRGETWVDDFALETVGTEVATTNTAGDARDDNDGGIGAPGHRVVMRELRRVDLQAYRFAPTRPVNLDFEQTAVIASR